MKLKLGMQKGMHLDTCPFMSHSHNCAAAGIHISRNKNERQMTRTNPILELPTGEAYYQGPSVLHLVPVLQAVTCIIELQEAGLLQPYFSGKQRGGQAGSAIIDKDLRWAARSPSSGGRCRNTGNLS